MVADVCSIYTTSTVTSPLETSSTAQWSTKSQWFVWHKYVKGRPTRTFGSKLTLLVQFVLDSWGSYHPFCERSPPFDLLNRQSTITESSFIESTSLSRPHTIGSGHMGHSARESYNSMCQALSWVRQWQSQWADSTRSCRTNGSVFPKLDGTFLVLQISFVWEMT